MFGIPDRGTATVIKAGGLTFDSEAETGFTIPPAGFTGWVDPVSFRRDDKERNGRHGSFESPVYASGRLVTIAGTCFATSPEGLDRYGELLAGLGATGKPIRVTVHHARRTMWADAYRAAGAEFDPRPALGRARYALDLWFPNPRKFGELREYVSTGSSVQAFHYGNFDADPVFEVSGFVNGYRITGPSGSYTVPGPKAASTVDRIDFSTGSFVRNGVPVTRAPSAVRRWSVPAGERVSWRVQPIGSGTGSARMFLTDTWI